MVVKEYVQHHVAEATHRCIHCGSEEFYEAYGAIDRGFYRESLAKNYPYMQIIFIWICRFFNIKPLG